MILRSDQISQRRESRFLHVEGGGEVVRLHTHCHDAARTD